jgi:hypothetical protein
MAAPAKKWWEEAPYGWEIAEDVFGPFLRPVSGEQQTIRYIRKLRAFGSSLKEISEQLERDALPPRGGGRWKRGELSEILEYNDEVLWRRWRRRLEGRAPEDPA